MLADDQESQSVDQSSEHNQQQVQKGSESLANSIKSPHFGDRARAGVVPIPLEQNNSSKNDDV